MGTTKYAVLESFLTAGEEQSIVNEVLACHRTHCRDPSDLIVDAYRTNSMKLELGIGCGGDVASALEISTSVARRAFRQASQLMPMHKDAIERLIDPNTPLTGLSLLYGPSSSMTPHYDSPTQPGQREEWLCMMTMGLPCVFRLDDLTIELKSRDALVMDSKATLHGVEKISESEDGDLCSRIGLPTNCRLGVLLWQGRSPTLSSEHTRDFPVVDGLESMFAESEDT
jgi:hypothetical protein